MQYLHDSVVSFLAGGLQDAAWWQVVLYALATTHVTIAAVTIFLHRSQAHLALDLHPLPAHFFRLWLWLMTGMVTKHWVAIHRKHHAKCETEDDPHSPQTRGIKAVLFQGSELYRAEAKNEETLAKFGHKTPNDWLERHIYSRFVYGGIVLTFVIDVVLFGVIGISVWAVQMLWIPITAAGVINGLGHFWGYRNFESPDMATNISPWGIVIGGEELHNNHHTYPTSAKLSVKSYEFDIGWAYIRGLEMLGLATVHKTPPRLALGAIKPVADSETLEVVIAHRYEVMAKYAKELRRATYAELARLKAEGLKNSAKFTQLKLARRWLHRDDDKIPHNVKEQIAATRAEHPVLDRLVMMREELREVWTRNVPNGQREQLVRHLQGWCERAEASGIPWLQAFARKLRAIHD